MKKLFGLITASIIFSQTAMSLTQTPVLSFESRRLSVKDGLPSNFVNSLYQDADGYVWIGTGSGLCRYDGFNIYNFKNLGPDNGQHKVGVADLYGQDNGNTLRIETTTNDVALYDLNTATFTSYLPDAGPMKKKNKYPYLEYQDGEYRLESSKDGVLSVYKGNRLTFTYSIIENVALVQNRTPKFRVARDRQGLFYIASYGSGLYIYNPATEKVSHFQESDPNPIIETDFLTAVMVDREQNIWLGNDASGITILTSTESFRTSYLYPEPAKHFASHNLVRAITPIDHDHFFVATFTGKTYIYDLESKSFNPQSDLGCKAYCCLFDSRGHEWIGTMNGLVYDGIRYTPDDSVHKFPVKKIYDIAEDKQGRIWMATFGAGVVVAEPRNHGKDGASKNSPLTFRTFLTEGLNQSHTFDLELTSDGILWIASTDGLYRFDTSLPQIDNDNFKHYSAENGQLPGDLTLSLHNMRDNTLCCAITGLGIALLKFEGDSIVSRSVIDKSHGLLTNNVRALCEDYYGNLWAAMEEDIARIDLQHGVLDNYNFAKNVQGNIFSENCICRTDDGAFLVGTYDGILRIEGNMDFRERDHLEISDIHVFDQSLLESQQGNVKGPLNKVNRIELNHSQNSVTFYFTDFDFVKLSSQLFEYWLEGYDKDWHEASTQNSASYDRLSPGTYTFHVRKRNNPEAETTLEVIIHRPWWNSWWAWIIYLVLIAVGGKYLYDNWKERLKLKQDLRVNRQVSEFRINFFTHIAHEFRTPLSIIQNSIDKISDGHSDPVVISAAERGTQRLRRLVDQLMEFRKMNSGNARLHVAEGDVIAFISNIVDDFWHVAELKEQHLGYHPFDHSYKMLFDSKVVESITYNLLSNATKYASPKGDIDVSVRLEEGQLALRVINDGPGISEQQLKHLYEPFMHGLASQGGMGIGLYMARQMAQLHHGSLEYSQVDGKTCFTASLPVGSENYTEEEREKTASPYPANQTPEMTPMLKGMAGNAINPQRVAIVEDDPDMQEQLRQELSPFFLLDIYSDGQQALEGIKQQQPDLVLCDVMLPGMDGFEVVHTLRNDTSIVHVPVIMLTALDDERYQVKAYKSGVEDYMVKPCSYKLLIARMVQLMKWSGQNIQTKALNQTAAPIISSVSDQRFLSSVDNLLHQHLSDASYNMDHLAQDLCIGRTKLFGRVHDLTGLSPNKYFTKMKMEEASRLLIETDQTVKEISYALGWIEQNNFLHTFKTYFGMTPSDYRKSR